VSETNVTIKVGWCDKQLVTGYWLSSLKRENGPTCLSWQAGSLGRAACFIKNIVEILTNLSKILTSTHLSAEAARQQQYRKKQQRS
jgi:hypothetical protein